VSNGEWCDRFASEQRHHTAVIWLCCFGLHGRFLRACFLSMHSFKEELVFQGLVAASTGCDCPFVIMKGEHPLLCCLSRTKLVQLYCTCLGVKCLCLHVCVCWGVRFNVLHICTEVALWWYWRRVGVNNVELAEEQHHLTSVLRVVVAIFGMLSETERKLCKGWGKALFSLYVHSLRGYINWGCISVGWCV
jgi:hypothetical protein